MASSEYWAEITLCQRHFLIITTPCFNHTVRSSLSAPVLSWLLSRSCTSQSLKDARNYLPRAIAAQLDGTKITGFKLIRTNSYMLVMASWQPVAYTLERPVPEWTAEAASDAASRTDVVRLHDAEPMEFILSSNWVLQTEGVKDFYEVLHKRAEVASFHLLIPYPLTIHGFVADLYTEFGDRIRYHPLCLQDKMLVT